MFKRFNNSRSLLLLTLVLVLALLVPSVISAQDDAARPFVGIRFEETEDGPVIKEVLPDSPAEEAGLQVDDLIMAIAGGDATEPVDIDETTTLVTEILKYAPGDVITVYIGRTDMQLGVEVTLADAADFVIEPEEVTPAEPMPLDPMPLMPDLGDTDQAFLGVNYMTITPDNSAMLAEDEEAPVTVPDGVTEGALIIDVLEDTPAAAAALLPGDVVTAVDGDVVDVERELADRLYAYEPDDTVTLTILRDGETVEVEATLMARPAAYGMGRGFSMMMPGHEDFPMMPFGMFMDPDFDLDAFLEEHPEMKDFMENFDMENFMENFDMEDMGPGMHLRMPGFMLDLPEEAFTDPDFDWDGYLEEHPEFAEFLSMFGEDFDVGDLAEMLPNFPWFGKGDPFHDHMDPMHADEQDA